MSKSNSFKKSRKLALGIAVAMGCSFAAVAFADGAIVAPSGITTDSTVTSVTATDNMIAGGQWLPNIGAAVSASGNNTVLNMNLGKNALTVNGYGSSHSTGIAAIDKGVVNINNPGAMSVTAESTGGGQTAALFVNSGGKIFVHNANTSGSTTLEKQKLTLTGTTTNSTNGAVVKAMNGVNGTRSYIKIDGLVDINADTTDGVGMSEAVSAVASTIDIGGGNIFATKKGVNPGLNYGFAENCAIRAYGEFVSSNYGIVNVNVTKESNALDAKATGAGDNDVRILGDFNTVGGMGTKGTINVGLNTEKSYWNGNYIKGAGWGETPGDYGSVNLFMGNGAQWIGNASFATNVKMSDEGTVWKGYSLNNAVSADISDDAAWYNYNEADTTALLRLNGGSNADRAGLVYMTPFTKKVNGGDVAYNTGNVSIANYSGNMKVFYNHDASDVSSILGGNFTIASAASGSAIKLITDNTGININNSSQVNNVLDNLAKKLYYTAYTSGERNLDGSVVIAEGLTSASAEKKTGSINYNTTTGQGYLNTNATNITKTRLLKAFKAHDSQQLMTLAGESENGLVFNNSITGDTAKDTDYIAAGVITDDGIYSFNKDVTINTKEHQLIRKVASGYSRYNRFCAPIYAFNGQNATINMNGNTLNVNVLATDWPEDNKNYLGIAAQKGSTIEVNNPGAININFDKIGDSKAGIVAAAGGNVFIHNGGENLEQKILSIKSPDGELIYAISAETKKSTTGQASKVVIDGLVDIYAPDKVSPNTVSLANAVISDSSVVDIAGGKIIGRLTSKKSFETIDTAQININVNKDTDGNIIGAGDNIVRIEGEVTTLGSAGASQVNIGLNGAESYLKGDVRGAEEAAAKEYGNGSSADGLTNCGVNLFINNNASWNGNLGGVATIRMHSGAIWHGGARDLQNGNSDSKINNMSMTLDTNSVWYNTSYADINVDYFTGGKDEATRGTIVMDCDKDITLNNYSGNTVVSFNRDSEYPTRVLGGNITIGSAAEGSAITLSTDNDGIDTSNAGEVSKVLRKLANKLTYTGAIEGAENNLDGYVQIAEGLTASSAALKLGDINFSAEDGKGSLKEGSIITPENKKNPEVIYGDKETAMMKGAKTAMASAALLWRAENNDLMKRMGDLRLSEDESGIWAKYYGGKYSMDAQNTDLNLKYNAYQVGYDKKVGNGWKAGVALSYNDGNSSYGNGRADIKGTSLGLYGTWQGDSGQYLDLIAKYTRLENEFDVRNAYGHKLNDDYKTWGASLSAEYGKRFEGKNGLYVDPSLELTVGRIAAKDYAATSDYLNAWGKNKNMDVAQDAFTSCIARLGVRVGQTTDNASYFVKLAAAHEFSGDFDSAFRAVGEQGGKTSLDFGDTWYEAQVGVTAKLSAANTFYATYGCSFGGDVEQKYRLDAGLRWSF